MNEEEVKVTNPDERNISNLSERILEASMDGFCIFSVDGRLLEVNSSLCDITGYTKEELLKSKITDIEVLETAEQTAQHIDNVMNLGNDRFETKLRRKDGRVIDIEVSTKFFESDEDKSFFSFFRDITGKKKAEKVLRESEERHKTLFESAAEGILVVEIETKKFKYANPALCKMLGYTQEEIKTISISDIHPKKDLEHVLSEFEAQARGEKILSPSIPCLRKDKTIIYADIKTGKVVIDGRECNAGFFTNITERKRIKDELENYKEKVLQSQKHAYIDSMGAIIAHELNQPLTMINMLLGRAIEQLENEPCSSLVLKNTQQSFEAAKKAASIVHKFHRYPREPALETIEKVSVNGIATKIRSVLSEKAHNRKMYMRAKGLDDLPDIEFNEIALEQIFFIIIQNAIEAADGRKSHKLIITGKSVEEKIELQFSDDCRGIAPENLDKIFEPFFSTKTEDKGLGLGLEIVQQILISCGGQIRVESRPGKGTTFYVTLPVAGIMKEQKQSENQDKTT